MIYMLPDNFLIFSAVPPANTAKAEVVDWGSDKDEYKVGDTATVRIAIKNNGDSAVNDIQLQAGIEKEFLGAYIKLISQRLDVPIKGIKPGETEQFKQSTQIPNFPGKYRVTVTVLIDGNAIDKLQKIITVSR